MAGPETAAWLDDVWARTSAVQIADGGESDGPISGRAVRAVFTTAAAVGELRALATTGRFTGDVCRCPGQPTLILRGTAGQVLGSGSLHGYGRLGWERRRFHDDLVVADPAGLHLLLASHGVPGQLVAFLAPLADLLNLHERDQEPQFRPAGKAGLPYLTNRGAPRALHPALSTFTGQQAGELPATQLNDLRRILAAAVPSPVDQGTVLLSWLGRLPIPAEALWGDGELIRQLLAGLSQADLAAAAATTDSAAVAMGVVNLVFHTGDDGTYATAINATLRHLFPPPPRLRDEPVAANPR